MVNTHSVKDHMVYNDESFVKKILHSDRNILSFVLNFKVGQILPRHDHEQSTLMLFVLKGKGEARVNDVSYQLSQGTVLKADGPDVFAIPKVEEDMSVLVHLGPNPSNEIYALDIG